MADDTVNKTSGEEIKILQDDIALEKFIEDLVTAREDIWVKPENRDRFKNALMNQLKDEINQYFINQLTQDDQKLLSKLLDQGITNEQLKKFFETRVDNHMAHLAIIFSRFKETLMVGKKNNPTNQ